MARLRLDLDQETYSKLLDSALAEKRPVEWHAGVVIRRALGLPFPLPIGEQSKQSERPSRREVPHAGTP